MDELTAYVFKAYRHLLTPEEWETYQTLLVDSKDTANARALLAKVWHGRESELAKVLEQDPDKYFASVKDRILRDHSGEIVINRCSKCGALAQTPQARQCLRCGYDWH